MSFRVAAYAFQPAVCFVVLVVGSYMLKAFWRQGTGLARATMQLTVVPGSLWTTEDRQGYRVWKVLTKHKKGVHIRIYSKTFAERPTSAVDMSELEQDEWISSEKLKQLLSAGLLPGIGHMAVTWGSFWASRPVLLQYDSVDESEMTGYHVWVERKEGYWGS